MIPTPDPNPKGVSATASKGVPLGARPRACSLASCSRARVGVRVGVRVRVRVGVRVRVRVEARVRVRVEARVRVGARIRACAGVPARVRALGLGLG